MKMQRSATAPLQLLRSSSSGASPAFGARWPTTTTTTTRSAARCSFFCGLPRPTGLLLPFRAASSTVEVEKGGGRGGRGRGRSGKGRRGGEGGGTKEKQAAAGVFSMKQARGVEDVEALRGLLQEHYHDVPVPVREKRQQRTIPFEEERQRLAFRQRIGPAGHEILAGQKSIVSAGDHFRFSCTACGKCCTRSFSEHVVLDPHDLYLLSRAPSLAPLLAHVDADPESGGEKLRPRRTSQLLSRYAHAFSQEMGLYATRHGEEVQAPVLMLRGRRADFAAASSTTAGGGDDNDEGRAGHGERDGTTAATKSPRGKATAAKQGWCHFAYPETAGASGGAPIRSFAEYTQLRAEGKVTDADMQGRVRCGLGPEHMPFACSSFPLGELWTSSVKTKHGASEAKRKIRFYWLDQLNCEGVDHPAAEQRRVEDYVRDNRTDERLGEWEWFKDLVGDLGQRKLDDRLLERDPSGWAANVFFSILHAIWYDFDSFEDQADSPAGDGAGEWARLKERMQERTERAVADLERFCLAGSWSPPSSPAEAARAEELFEQSFHSFLGKMVHDAILTPDALALALEQRHSLDAQGDDDNDDASDADLDDHDDEDEQDDDDDDDPDLSSGEDEEEEYEDEVPRR